MNAIMAQGFGGGQVPAVFRQAAPGTFGDLEHGLTAGFGTVRYKGKTWKVKYQGQEFLWRDQNGQPTSYVDVVIINAASHISKQWYEGGFVEGAEVGAPQCWSVNGIAPDPASPKKQHVSCVACPKNAWGSRQGANGKQAKACSDRRRLAIVPANLLMQGMGGPFGGPVLLTVPPTSLKDLATFQRQLQSMGFPYYAVVARISFDLNLAYPRLMFEAVRPLTDEEAPMVLNLAQDEYTQRMLQTAVDEEVQHDEPTEPSPFANAAPAAAFQQAPPTMQPQPMQQPQPVYAPPAEQVVDVAFTPVQQPQAAPQPQPAPQQANMFAPAQPAPQPQQQANPFAAPQQAPANDPFAQQGGPAPSAATEKAKRTRAAAPKPVEAPPAAAAPAGLDDALSKVFG